MQKLKRDNGSTASSILPNFFCIVVVLVFVMLFTSWVANVDRRENLNQICRKYILQMETTGYLTTEMANNLTNELMTAGMTSVTIESDTTREQVDFGADIFLKISGTMYAFDYRVQGPGTSKMMEIISGSDSWNVHVYKTSISKAPKDRIITDDSIYLYVETGVNGQTIYNGAVSPRKIKMEKGDDAKLQITSADGYKLSMLTYGTPMHKTEMEFVISDSATSATYNQSTNTYTVPANAGTYSISLPSGVDGVTSVTIYNKSIIGLIFDIKNMQEDKSLTLSFAPQEGLIYTVHHYQRELDGVTVKLVETETFNTGIMGTPVSPDVKTYEGFISPEKQTIIIGLGTNNVDYVYERERHSFAITMPSFKNDPDNTPPAEDLDEMIEDNIYTTGSSENGSYFYGETINVHIEVAESMKSVFTVSGFNSNWNGRTFNNTATFTMPNQDVELIPNIAISKYTVKYDANGGTGSVASQTVGYFKEFKLATGGFSRQYFNFLGWATNPKADFIEYEPGEEVYSLTQSSSITLYAIWEDMGKTSFTVNYYLEDENGVPMFQESKVISDGIFSTNIIDVETLRDPKYEIAGQNTFGYATINGGRVTSFSPAADGTTEVDVYYTRLQYTLTVIPSSRSQINATDGYILNLYAGEEVVLEPTFYNGYKFREWDIKSTASFTVYEDADTHTLSFNMPAADVTVELLHNTITYYIHYDLNGGEWLDNEYQKYLEYNVETAEFSLPIPVRSHYTFIGWTTDTISTPQMILTISQGTTGDINVFANWLAAQYKLIIYCDSIDQGIVQINDQDVVFVGGKYETDVFYETDITLSFIPNEYVSVVSLVRTLTDDTEQETTTLINRENATMATQTDEINFKTGAIYNVEFAPLNYTVTYHSNTKADAKIVQTMTFNTDETIRTIEDIRAESSAFTVAGCDFVGWAYTETDYIYGDTFVIYKGGETVRNIASQNDENIDLYAVYMDVTPPTITGVNITNNVAEEQTITVTAIDNESGIGGYYFSTTKLELDDPALKTADFSETNTFKVTDKMSIWIYVRDLAGNMTTNGIEYKFHKTTLVTPEDASVDSLINYIITWDGKSFTFPTASKQYCIYKGWSTDPDATNGIKTLTPTASETYYPIFLEVEAYLLPGTYVNTAFKQLVNASSSYQAVDNTITSIVFTTDKPGDGVKNFKITESYGATILAYRDGTTIKLYCSGSALPEFKVYYNGEASYMFYNLRKVSNNELVSKSAINTTRTIDLSYTFAYYGYSDLTTLDLTNFDTSSVFTMEAMFAYCGYNNMNLLNLGNNFDTSNVMTMVSMFTATGYNKMSSLNLGNKFNTKNVLDMTSMFAYCGYNSLQSINFGNQFRSDSLSSVDLMFSYFGYNKLQTLTIPSMFTCNNASMDSMFNHCGGTAMTYLDISSIQGTLARKLCNVYGDGTVETLDPILFYYAGFINGAGKPGNCTVKVCNQNAVDTLYANKYFAPGNMYPNNIIT